MNQLVAYTLTNSLKGLTSAPVPACSCAKGLAVGVSMGWTALHQLWQSLAPNAHLSGGHITITPKSSIDTNAGRDHQLHSTQKVDSSKSADMTPIYPPELNNSDGMLAAHHAVYMRSIMLRFSNQP